MSKTVKWIIGAVGILIGLLIIISLSLPFFIDPNDYKTTIAQKVQEQTGRELSMPGDINLDFSIFGLKTVFSIGDVSLSSSSAFPNTEFFSSRLVKINLALWPLISSKELKINNVRLEGVTLSLIRSKDGKGNWEMPAGGGDKKDETASEAKQAPGGEKEGRGLAAIDIGGVTIKDINLSLDDRQAGRTVKLSNFNLNVGHLVMGKPFPVDASFSISVDDGKQPLHASTELSATLNVNLVKQLYVIDKLKLQTDIDGAPVPVKHLGLNMQAEADLVNSLATLSSLQIQLDDTTITGSAEVANFNANPAYDLDLHIDQIDLDKYKVRQQPETSTNGMGQQTTQSAGNGGASMGESGEQPIIPVELLRKLTFTGKIKIDRLKAAKLTITNIQLDATGKEGLVRLQPFAADLYEGTINVTGDIDARPDIPEMKLTKVLKSVEMGPLFIDMTGNPEVKGKANINAKVTTRGLTMTQLKSHANGNMNLDLSNCEIAKLKIIDTIRTAKALLDTMQSDKKQPADNKQNAKKDKSAKLPPPGRPTGFASLTASGVIVNGVFKNEDLLADSELMKVEGKGTVDLNTEQINYLLTIYLAKSLDKNQETGLVDLAGTPIPYRIKGTFDKIEQSAALDEILKSQATKTLINELGKRLDGDKPKDGAKKKSGGTEEMLNKGLKSLFGN